MTVCLSDGYILEVEGPFKARLNDAEILKIMLERDNGISTFLQVEDHAVVDRGFRDVIQELEHASIELDNTLEGAQQIKGTSASVYPEQDVSELVRIL
ncbi:hypothetical protein ILUMI_18095 [Ignelater luminosus]|uniref:Uncharacterized protein n=1 Tax=Ignelater luminosus TaxID=2038154 RepID=A0A8K0G6W2_IGNLU|nr:hypothetical protein ILUMI_18095 [Ignelater luminosus]